MTASSVPTFAPIDRAAQWTKGLLRATLALSVLGTVSGLLQLELLSRAATTGISQAEAVANDSRQQLLGLLQILSGLGTAVGFLFWFHGAHKNLASLGTRDLKYTPGWAVGGFFVPFLNLARPLQVMREVWHGSDPSGGEHNGFDGRARRGQLGTPGLVGWWWALFIVSGLVGHISMRTALAPNPSIYQLQALSVLLVLSDLINVPAAVLAVRLVTRITRWQAERLERVQQIASQTLTDSTAEPRVAV